MGRGLNAVVTWIGYCCLSHVLRSGISVHDPFDTLAALSCHGLETTGRGLEQSFLDPIVWINRSKSIKSH